MRRPLHSSKFDPDNLEFYIQDHLNVPVRVKRLGFAPIQAKASRIASATHYLDVPLARGYKHESAKRPANFCRIALSGDLCANSDIYVYFSFGWLRRTSSVYKIKHTLVEVPHNRFDVRYGLSEHQHLEEFETELATLINTLRTFTFNDLATLCRFMEAWCRHHYSDDRVKEAFDETNKFKPKEETEPPKKDKVVSHRIGHRRYSHRVPSFRGH
jgi:hypothetical protein